MCSHHCLPGGRANGQEETFPTTFLPFGGGLVVKSEQELEWPKHEIPLSDILLPDIRWSVSERKGN